MLTEQEKGIHFPIINPDLWAFSSSLHGWGPHEKRIPPVREASSLPPSVTIEEAGSHWIFSRNCSRQVLAIRKPSVNARSTNGEEMTATKVRVGVAILVFGIISCAQSWAQQ